MYVLDISKSIGKTDDNFKLVKDFVNETFDLVNIGPTCSRAAVVLFARNATINFTVGEHSDRASAARALYEIIITDYGSEEERRGTNTPAALNLLREQSETLGLRPNVPHIVVFITDGNPWVPALRDDNDLKDDKNLIKQLEDEATTRAANRLKGSGIYRQILAIGIENKKGNLNDETLRLIANPSSLTFRVRGFTNEFFNELAQNITNQFCRRK